jgi:hypothetical protein
MKEAFTRKQRRKHGFVKCIMNIQGSTPIPHSIKCMFKIHASSFSTLLTFFWRDKTGSKSLEHDHQGTNNYAVIERPAPRYRRIATCWNCNQLGHMKRDCLEPKDWSRIECNNCGETGHGVRVSIRS